MTGRQQDFRDVFMTQIRFFTCRWGDVDSGGNIFDRRLCSALGQDVTAESLTTRRKPGLPLWNRRIETSPEKRPNCYNVVSHESLYELDTVLPVHCFVVHNYFSAFEFRGLPLLTTLYRRGSDRIYQRIFTASERVVFISFREYAQASRDYPHFANKFFCHPPGHNASDPFFAGPRSGDVIELPGTVDWLPKRLSYSLNLRGSKLDRIPFQHGNEPSAYISVIYDSFLSGFKLKLLEMAKHAKSIVSFCDLRDELSHLGFDRLRFRHVTNRQELHDAVAEFRRLGDLDEATRMDLYEHGVQYSWDALASIVSGNLDRPGSQQPT
jgi:hypothetical protein